MNARHNLSPILLTLAALCIWLAPSTAHAADAIESIFSDILGNFIDTLNTVKTTLLSRFKSGMTGPIKAAATLYILLYGLEVIVAPSQLNAKEALGRMAKVSIVVSLVLGTGTFDLGTKAYNFFMDLALGVPTSFMSSLNGGNHVMPSLSSMGGTPNALKSIFGDLDGIIKDMIEKQEFLGMSFKKLAGIGLVIAAAVPQVGGALFTLAKDMFMILANALLGILLSVAAITFLIAIGPLFIGFALFQITEGLFQSWLKNLVSYSLQILFVFAALALWGKVISDYAQFIDQLDKAVDQYATVYGPSAAVASPTNTWGIKKGTTTDGKTYNANAGAGASIAPNNAAKGGKDFIVFVFYNITALTALTYGFSALMKSAPSIAKGISGGDAGRGDNPGNGLGDFLSQVEHNVGDFNKQVTQSMHDSPAHDFAKQMSSLSGVRSGPK